MLSLLENIDFGFPGSPFALKAVSWEVRLGAGTLLAGVNGAGKTTLLKLAAGLHVPSRGRTPLSESASPWTMVFQRGGLFDTFTVFENVALPLREKFKLEGKALSTRVEEALESVGLHADQKKFPRDLSGGMQKRLGLARALAQRPEFLLCDEPTAGLDPLTSQEVLETLKDVQSQGQLTLVLASTRLSVGEGLCQDLHFFHRGKFIYQGDFERFEKTYFKDLS